MSWTSTFPDKVVLDDLISDGTWKDFILSYKWIDYLTDNLSKKITSTTFPYPNRVFACFNETPFESVKVVIVGQDPYHSVTGRMIDANGLSFSCNNKVTPSLRNIFENLKKHNHIDSIPTTGNLEPWAKQGVLLLNSSLTVEKGKPSSHVNIWEKLTDRLIRKLSKHKERVIFVLWGRYAKDKESLIDTTKHFVIKSSHPSPFSANTGDDAFNKIDHFGIINAKLTEWGMNPINWN